MKIQNFEEAVGKIQGHLKEYLEQNHISTGSNFLCLNPKHKEKTPSMSLIRPECKRVYCHGCGWTGDIFDVCGVLENKPVTSQAFVTETFMHLAKLFGVEVQTAELTEDEIYELDTYRAYKYAADFISNWSTKIPTDINSEFDRRGWDTSDEGRAKLQKLGVGFVSDLSEFRDFLKNKGFAAKFLDDVDLSRKDIFSPGHLIFTIKDEHGRPVGFAARNLTEHGSKYVNQKTTGVKVNIYQKGKRLYGLDVALRERGPIYIFEGYADVITANLHGINNCVAACGTSLTTDHISSLKEHRRFDLILCLDGDKPGQEKTADLLDKKFGGQRDINLRIINLPDDKDPDDYIREKGDAAFLALKQWTPFEWRLERFPEDADGEEVCNLMIPLVVNESSYITQETMLETLARHTGISLKTLQAELGRLLNEKERDRSQERRLILDKLSRDVNNHPDNAELLITEAQIKLQAVSKKYEEDKLSEDSTLQQVLGFKNREESKDGSFQGFVLGEDLHELQEALSGDWRKDIMAVFGGKANSGKTSFMAKLAYEIAIHEKENNACVIYHTIDDTTEQVLPKFICVAEGSTKLEINQVKDPNYYKNLEGCDGLDWRREQGYLTLTDLIKRGRFVIKDSNDGQSLAFAENMIRYYQNKYPDRQIVYVLDNFHKLKDFQDGGNGDERIRFKIISTLVKDMATRLHIPVLCTMEYTKLAAGVRPTNDNIAETVQMEYDANLIAHLWNGLHELGDAKADPTMYHMSFDAMGNLKKMPIVEMNIGKNKISAFKSRLYYQFYPGCSDFKPVPPELIQAAQEELRKEAQKSEMPTLFKKK